MEIAPLEISTRPCQIFKPVNGPLGVDHLTSLQSLGLRAGSWCNGEGLGKLIKLRELTIRVCLAVILGNVSNLFNTRMIKILRIKKVINAS